MRSKALMSALAVFASFLAFSPSADAKFRIKISSRGVELGPVRIPAPPGARVIDGIAKGKKVEDIARDAVKEHVDQITAVSTIPQVQTMIENIAVANITKILGKQVGDVVEIILFPQQIQRMAPGVVGEVAKDLIDGKRPDEILGIPLAMAVLQAKAQYIARSKPLPTQVQYLLATTFAPDILRSARYVVDDFGGNVAAIINKLQEVIGNEHAITLDNIIVFSREPKHENVFFWGHELGHVEQYRRLGIEGFAGRYTVAWRELENEADERGRAAEKNSEDVLKILNALAELQKD